MKYYDYLTKVIGQDSIYKGRAYPPYLIDYIDSFEEPRQYVHFFEVQSISSDNVYEVYIKNNGHDYYDATCTCPQYARAHTCKHVAACLMYYHFRMDDYEKIDIYKISNDILNYMYEPDETLSIKEKANIALNINAYRNNTECILKVGASKLYVLNTKSKLANFLRVYEHGGTFNLGAKFTYDKNKYYFDEEDTKIIEYFIGHERESYEPLSINDHDLDWILNNVSVSKLTINNQNIKGLVKGLPTNFNLSKNTNDEYVLKLENAKDYIALSYDFKYLLYQNYIYEVPKEARKFVSSLYNREIDTLIFPKNNLEKLNKGIISNIREFIKTDDNIPEINLNIKPKALIYLDIASVLNGEVKIKYDSKEINVFAKDNSVFRDYNYENAVLQDLVNCGFEIQKEKLVMDSIDSIGYFLENELEKLNEKYDIYTSKKLNNTSLIKKSKITKDFSIGANGIMSFSFSIDNIDEAELKSIFASLESKKTYHKLKNGNIINLESDEDLQELNNLMNDLEIKDYDTTIEIPKYRALYIDSLRNNKYQDIKTNNVFDEFINNFKEYQNVKINFTKTDDEVLRDYQKVGVRWLYTLYKCDLGGILADEMGLGKSIQAICFIKQVLKEKNDAKILIVCPTSLVYNWQKEFDKFAPELKYITVSDAKERRKQILNSSDYNIFITSYGLLRNDIEEYENINYEVCIIDEAQYIKNYQAKMTLSLKKVKAKNRIALTGTPLENSITELWSIFDFLMPGYLNSVKKFHEKYHISDVKKEDLEKLESLNYQIRPFILRRKKMEVSKDLPEKIENNIYLELPETQKKLYLSELKETKEEIEELMATEGYKKARFKILTLLTKLRQICIEPNVLYTNYQGESIKMEKIVEMVQDYAKEQHKILIFSSFKRILDLLKERLDKEHISYYSIDGNIKGKERVSLVEKFNEDDTTCFLITLKSGGTGLNLTSADIVIHLDIWWNPQVENQATDRAHRIGQKNNVIVNKLITQGTIEERILELQEKKRILSDNLIEGKTEADMLGSLSEDDVKELLSYAQD